MVTAKTTRAMWSGFERHMDVKRGERDTFSMSCMDYQLLVIDRGNGLVSFIPTDDSGTPLQGSMMEPGLIAIDLGNPAWRSCLHL